MRRGSSASTGSKNAEAATSDESMPNFAKPAVRPMSLLGLDKLAASKRANQNDEKRAAAKAKLFGSGRVLSSAAQELGDEEGGILYFSCPMILLQCFTVSLFFLFSGTISKEKKRKFREKVRCLFMFMQLVFVD